MNTEEDMLSVITEHGGEAASDSVADEILSLANTFIAKLDAAGFVIEKKESIRRCSNCRHYRPDPEQSPLGACWRWRGGNGYDGYYWESKDIASNEVVVETDENWGARMGPDFGCVLWEPKP